MSNKYALLIGNDLFSDKRLQRLYAPRADIGGLAGVMGDSEIGNNPDRNIRFSMNSQLEAVQANLH